MPADSVTLAVVGVELGVEIVDTVVVVRGEIDVASSPVLDGVVADLTGPDIVLDLAGVTFMGSVGLASLLRADRRAGQLGGRLVLRSPSRQVRDLLDMTRLVDRFTIDPT